MISWHIIEFIKFSIISYLETSLFFHIWDSVVLTNASTLKPEPQCTTLDAKHHWQAFKKHFKSKLMKKETHLLHRIYNWFCIYINSTYFNRILSSLHGNNCIVSIISDTIETLFRRKFLFRQIIVIFFFLLQKRQGTKCGRNR